MRAAGRTLVIVRLDIRPGTQQRHVFFEILVHRSKFLTADISCPSCCIASANGLHIISLAFGAGCFPHVARRPASSTGFTRLKCGESNRFMAILTLYATVQGFLHQFRPLLTHDKEIVPILIEILEPILISKCFWPDCEFRQVR